MNKELLKEKIKSPANYSNALLEKLLESFEFSNDQYTEIIENLISVKKTIKKTEDETKNKNVIEAINKLIQTTKERKNETKIINKLDLNEPSWLEKILPKSNRLIEKRLEKIRKEISKIKIPEVKIPEEIKLKKSNWITATTKNITGELIEFIQDFFEDLISRRIFKIKSDKPLDVVITDKQGKRVDIGGKAIMSGGSFSKNGLATEAKQDDILTETKAFGTLRTTAVTLAEADTAELLPDIEQANRRGIILYNVSDTDMYYGDSSVTTTNGILLASGAEVSLDISTGLYVVCGVDNKTINILELK